jgi:hypothetical protein
MDVSNTNIWFFMYLTPRVVVSHTVSHVSARSVVLPLSPAAGSRLLLLTVGSHIFAYPSAAVPSHAGLIRLAILPNRSAVSAPEPPSSALPVSAPEPPAQALSLLPHLHQTTTLQRLHITGTESGAPLLPMGAFALSFK